MIRVGSTVTPNAHHTRKVTPEIGAWVRTNTGREFHVIDAMDGYVRIEKYSSWISVELLIERPRFTSKLIKTEVALKGKKAVQEAEPALW